MADAYSSPDRFPGAVEKGAGMLISEWSRGSAIDRSRDKLEAVVRWLAWFDYSDRETIAGMLGVAADGQNAFFKKLETSGFVVSDTAPGIRRRILSLADAGFEYARMLVPELDLKRRRRLPSWVSLIHSLSIQVAIIARWSDIESLRPEKTLKHLRAVRLPDAILTFKDGRRVALEVELNHKSTARVYNIYLSHLKNIRAEHYSQVAYVFPNEQLARLYQSKFEQPVWPVYRPGVGAKLMLDTMRTFDAAPVHRRELFTFSVEGLYAL
ncbi:MAG TPA: hypothetical protein ENI17_02860 [Pseudomonas xinjiangensis]|uniref:Replication-relaxation n=2 Tax=root TaxID=1 RepID=A0A7V1BRL6_9GAMM|nr:hypothetical protein [Halopseudomonas xinjiangensis]HEC46549.1 hypothetical protein [Halopseudomonas xinjiangensis]